MATVLVIDDETPIVDLLADIVAEKGHLPICANNGATGLALAREVRPSLIISDVMMPLLDGYALLRALRSEPELANTAVVLISAGFPRGVQLQIDPPADAYIRKPFDVSAVEAVLDQLVYDEQLA
ncbi:MAG TPA: response regulator [Roseiflexaceae bacterium]|nr:response regulator [Roseiflexaceae bacterium]